MNSATSARASMRIVRRCVCRRKLGRVTPSVNTFSVGRTSPIGFGPVVGFYGGGVVTVLLIVAATAALADWWAVGGRHRRAEVVLKPLAMAALVGVAATIGDASGDVRAPLVFGAVLGLAGDVALLFDGTAAFLAGLGAFAIGHLGYTVAAVFVDARVSWMVPGALSMAGLLGYRFASQTVAGARRQGGRTMEFAVWCYAAIITAMVVSAWGTAVAIAAAGATLFALSDWVLGYQRFVAPLPGRRLSVMVPYHVGQAMLIVGLATS